MPTSVVRVEMGSQLPNNPHGHTLSPYHTLAHNNDSTIKNAHLNGVLMKDGLPVRHSPIVWQGQIQGFSLARQDIFAKSARGPWDRIATTDGQRPADVAPGLAGLGRGKWTNRVVLLACKARM